MEALVHSRDEKGTAVVGHLVRTEPWLFMRKIYVLQILEYISIPYF